MQAEKQAGKAGKACKAEKQSGKAWGKVGKDLEQKLTVNWFRLQVSFRFESNHLWTVEIVAY